MSYFLTDNVIYANARMRATSSNGASQSNQLPVIYETVEYDTAGTYNNATGQYEIPADGAYHITGRISLNNILASNRLNIYIRVNNINRAYTGDNARSDSNYGSIEISDTLVLNKGDLVTIVPEYNNGPFTKDTVSIANTFSVHRVADYSAGQPIGFGVATEGQYGLVKAVSGSYTPTVTNVNGFSAIGAELAYYTVLNNIVTVHGKFAAALTPDGTLGQADISLPIAKNFTSANECFGTCGATRISTAWSNGGYIESNLTNDTARMYLENTGGGAAALAIAFSFQYELD